VQRILIIVTVLYVIWRVLNAWGRRLGQRNAGAEHFSRYSGPRRQEPDEVTGREELMACDGCGTFVPDARTLLTPDGRRFCSDSCREEHDSIS